MKSFGIGLRLRVTALPFRITQRMPSNFGEAKSGNVSSLISLIVAANMGLNIFLHSHCRILTEHSSILGKDNPIAIGRDNLSSLWNREPLTIDLYNLTHKSTYLDWTSVF